jgi:hypothetical protein
VRRVAVVLMTGLVSSLLPLALVPHNPTIWALVAGVIGMLAANAVWRD